MDAANTGSPSPVVSFTSRSSGNGASDATVSPCTRASAGARPRTIRPLHNRARRVYGAVHREPLRQWNARMYRQQPPGAS